MGMDMYLHAKRSGDSDEKNRYTYCEIQAAHWRNNAKLHKAFEEFNSYSSFIDPALWYEIDRCELIEIKEWAIENGEDEIAAEIGGILDEFGIEYWFLYSCSW